MSSSSREPFAFTASVYRGDQVLGPLRLPQKNPSQFVESFNRIYRSTGIAIRPHDDVGKGELPESNESMDGD